MGRLMKIVLLIFILTGCQSHFNVKIDDSKLVVNMRGYSKKEAKTKSAFKVYRDLNTRFFIVKDEKIVYENLKFVKVLDAGAGETNEYELQILDKHNNRKTITIKSDVTTFPVYGCGTAAIMASINYEFSVSKILNAFMLQTSRTKGFEDSSKKSLSIFENDSAKVDELLFSNLKTKYRISDDSRPSERYVLVLFKKGEKYGIAGKIKIVEEEKNAKYSFEKTTRLSTFDKVTSLNGLLLVQKNSLLGYYGVTKIKYSSLEPFVYGLARFTLTNGKSGFIDQIGREYYD